MKRLQELGSTGPLCRTILAGLALAGLIVATENRAMAQGWPTYGHDQQHTLQAAAASQALNKVRWSTPVDLNPPFNNGELFIHYGSPIITRINTVLVPVRTVSGGFQVTAINGATGATVWTQATDYTLPAAQWYPIFGISLTPRDQYLVLPGAGGTVYVRTFPDYPVSKSPTKVYSTQYAFYNGSTPVGSNTSGDLYSSNPAAFQSAIQICTPVSSDALGNLYFGFTSSGAALPGYPNGIPGGLAKISSTGVGSFVAATTLSGDGGMNKVAYNCAPAFSADGSLVYTVVNNGSTGYLCAVNTTTLTTTWSIRLKDPSIPANDALVSDLGSATPTVGPDGDIYYGVLSGNGSGNQYRGFLLHFSATYNSSNQTYTVNTKLPSAFGWDDTPSVVPTTAVPSYSGSSSYLLLTKFNDYGEGGGTGQNKCALVDPNVSMVDPISGVTVMNPFMTVLGVTPDPSFPNLPGAVREWCINSAAVDLVNQCAIVNSEDGSVYRWSFATNSLSAGLPLAKATGEAYTPTVIGPDGAVYAINRAVLNCCAAQ